MSDMGLVGQACERECECGGVGGGGANKNFMYAYVVIDYLHDNAWDTPAVADDL